MARRTLPGWLAAPVVGAGLLSMLSGAAQFGVTAVLGEVALAFGAATTAQVEGSIGMSAGTLGLGLAVIRLAGAGSLLGSSVADRLGRRPVLLAATSIGLLLTLLATLAPTFWVFVAIIACSRPLLSTTNAVTAVVAAEETDAHDRTAALAFIAAAYAGGSGAVSIARGATGMLDFRTLLVVVGLFVVVVPGIARLLREPPVTARVAGAVRPAFGTVAGPAVRPLLVLCLLAAATNLVTGPAFTFLFVYGENVLGSSPARMAVLVLAAGPAGLAGLLLGRFLGDRVGRRATALGGTLVIAAAGMWSYNGGQPALFAGYLVLIVAAAASGPPAAALLNEAMPTEVRATANGWAAAAGVVGAVTGLTLFGALAGDAAAFDRAAWLLFTPVVPVAFCYLLLPETAGTDELPTTAEAAELL